METLEVGNIHTNEVCGFWKGIYKRTQMWSSRREVHSSKRKKNITSNSQEFVRDAFSHHGHHHTKTLMIKKNRNIQTVASKRVKLSLKKKHTRSGFRWVTPHRSHNWNKVLMFVGFVPVGEEGQGWDKKRKCDWERRTIVCMYVCGYNHEEVQFS